MTDYLYDRTGEDPTVAELEGLLGDYAHRAPLREPPPRRRSWRTGARIAAIGSLAAAALVVIVVLVVLGVVRRGDEGPSGDCPPGGAGFAFEVTGSPARCAGSVASHGTLPVGAWLETAGDAVADVRVADIGDLTVYGGSRVRLVGTGAGGHHLALASGRVAARVIAPPRLFVVDTPVATAVDLGCAYELTVDDDGRTRLHVTAGAVSLEGHGQLAYTPIGTEVVALAGRGPGTPVAIGAPDELRAAVTRFDAGELAALRTIVALAGPRDTFTLWNLLSRTTAADRAAVAARLDALSPRPGWVSAGAVLAGDRAALERWRADLQVRWICPDCLPHR